MSKRQNAIVCPNKCRDVLGSVAGGLYQANGRGKRVTFRGTTFPDVVFVNSPVVVEAGIREKSGVECMVRVVMREDDVGDGFGRLAERGQWFEYGIGSGYHAGVYDDAHISLAHKSDG